MFISAPTNLTVTEFAIGKVVFIAQPNHTEPAIHPHEKTLSLLARPVIPSLDGLPLLMIQDAKGIGLGEVLSCDVCIVGGGAAGISIAKELAATSWRVFVLEGGARKETPQARSLYRGFTDPDSSHEPLEENRRRQLGGTTSVWGGRCVLFDEIDFEKREWVGRSGWPFAKSEIDPYYARAMRLCEAGQCQFRPEEALPGTQPEMIAGFDGGAVVSSALERWGPPTRFGTRYYRDLRSSTNVTAFLNANCIHLQLNSVGDRIKQIEVASFAKNRFMVKARLFVLACGGLETARLLLASNDVKRHGIGNHSDKLGRYYMSHLHGAVAVASLRNHTKGFLYDFETDREQVYCRRRFWITPEAQRKNEMLNFIAYFFRPSLTDVTHRDALLSTIYLAKLLSTAVSRSRFDQLPSVFRRDRSLLEFHLKTALAHLPSLIRPIMGILKDRFLSKRRVPMILPPKSKNSYYLFYQSEHAPNFHSRVFLDSEKDCFGMPRLRVKVAFSDIDAHTVLRAHQLIKEQFETTNTGELHYDKMALVKEVEHQTRHFNSAGHQLGTTRMSVDADDGVVDIDCKVHGVENLYVAGGAVFPTSSHANPTLTVVALALRLADKLQNRLPSSVTRLASA